MGMWDWLRGRDEAAVVVEAPPGPDDIEASLAAVNDLLDRGRAAPLIRTRVDAIAGLIREIVPRLNELGVGSADSYSVVATATDYLPQTVAGYLRLPRDWADTRPLDGGRTALMILIDQLELLQVTMSRMLDAAIRSDARALVAHGAFLQEKFGHGPSALDPGGTVGAPGTSDARLQPPPQEMS